MVGSDGMKCGEAPQRVKFVKARRHSSIYKSRDFCRTSRITLSINHCEGEDLDDVLLTMHQQHSTAKRKRSPSTNEGLLGSVSRFWEVLTGFWLLDLK